MADRVAPEVRSRIMRAIRGKNTRPELHVRRALHAAGFRFRLHQRDLPGRPDVVLPKHRTIVLVHGCFWHGHDGDGCPRGGRRPSSNAEFWSAKIDRNKERDARTVAALEAAGWRVVVVWECLLRGATERLVAELGGAAAKPPGREADGPLGPEHALLPEPPLAALDRGRDLAGCGRAVGDQEHEELGRLAHELASTVAELAGGVEHGEAVRVGVTEVTKPRAASD